MERFRSPQDTGDEVVPEHVLALEAELQTLGVDELVPVPGKHRVNCYLSHHFPQHEIAAMSPRERVAWYAILASGITVPQTDPGKPSLSKEQYPYLARALEAEGSPLPE